ncbi:MAG TPA: nucleoside 2-deoxyribosyltransferase [Candidatus Tectomicrobia bacterium]|jgi:nucleoside 2-deoxyribosyltransferase|nr:nucleoside 2-deoxyribosyltransferase [Candidatus Tectomicrobia bacterium]
MIKPDNTPYRIYCAGPLFNPSERAEMEMLAEAIEQGGFKTFLPHRDGFVFGAIVPDLVRAGYALDVAQWMARQAIFALDVQQVLLECDGTVVNLNGRVPDEGAVVEGAIAWTAGKPVVLFKDDARSKIDGLDNPLVAGLGGFRLVSRSEDLARALTRALTEHPPEKLQVDTLPATIRQAVERGQRLSDGYGTGDSRRLVQTIIELFDEFHGIA